MNNSNLLEKLESVVVLSGISITDRKDPSEFWRVLLANWISWVEQGIIIPVEYNNNRWVSFYWAIRPDQGRFMTQTGDMSPQAIEAVRQAIARVEWVDWQHFPWHRPESRATTDQLNCITQRVHRMIYNDRDGTEYVRPPEQST